MFVGPDGVFGRSYIFEAESIFEHIDILGSVPIHDLFDAEFEYIQIILFDELVGNRKLIHPLPFLFLQGILICISVPFMVHVAVISLDNQKHFILKFIDGAGADAGKVEAYFLYLYVGDLETVFYHPSLINLCEDDYGVELAG